MGSQLWLADKPKEFGLSVIEVDGWQTRGDEYLSPGGVVGHHTGDGATGELPTLSLLINGRSDLAGPLCNYGLARSGTVYVVASGRANHAGLGGWKGLVGNSSVLGIEAENNGSQGWPSKQYDAYVRLVASCLDALRRGPEWFCGHKEWAPGRKVDPGGIDMNEMRRAVAAALASAHGALRPRPKKDGSMSHIVIEHPTSGFAVLKTADGSVYNYDDHRKGGAPKYIGGMNLPHYKEYRSHAPHMKPCGGYFDEKGNLTIVYPDGGHYLFHADGRDVKPPRR